MVFLLASTEVRAMAALASLSRTVGFPPFREGFPDGPPDLAASRRKQAVMAKRVLNRRQLRQDADAAAARAPEVSSPADAAAEAADPKVKTKPKAKAKAAATPRPRKPRKPKAPVRQRARWGVFDNAMKQVAIFDYRERGAADQKVADLSARKGGSFFVQIVKEPMPEEVPGEAPAV
jgi:hypothetical protein